MSEMLIRVKAQTETPYYEGDYCDPELTQEVVTFEQLLAEANEYTLSQLGVVRVKATAGGKIDKATADKLKEFGWAHAATAQTREEKKVLEQEYYMIDHLGVNYSWNKPKFQKIDVDNLTKEQAKQLAGGARIVQAVTPKSVLSASQYKKIQTARKENAVAAQKKKATAAKRADAKKAKEVAKAKKLLQEAGEL
tara:strand:+ start:5548 stop:6129 length:582 start_codon:yes stop_codon:yes gene_type:complete